MTRLAIYAHFSPSPQVAAHVLFCLKHIKELGFQICFVSNSELSADSLKSLNALCDRVIVRENTGLDFCMWKRGMSEYDLLKFDELLLTNSSIIGPLRPLAPIWQNKSIARCDFWGLTDNDEFKFHLCSFFLVFRKQVLHSPRFRQFWDAVLPYKSKWQVIFNYELGLSAWLQEGGFEWRAVFNQQQIIAKYRAGRSLWRKYLDLYRAVRDVFRRRIFPSRNTSLIYPDILCQQGMPFVKTSLLHHKYSRMTPAKAFSLLENSLLPQEVLLELRQTYLAPDAPAKPLDIKQALEVAAK